ncbi:Putative Structure-specific recognition protein 1 [Rhizopus microsporus]|uniref:HMG box domain-containing protein n=2 Tax=Rhizopus microsporus TaxID=58291 RepID=A0A2G4SLG1_RHIZD|nr:uncharacterized protein RHIMIDRAFT_240278 [Rhizopus microsporus ATCC 52813]ORE05691.1 hypothetical protein BCV72DRAFT_242624 [Rhizopus microsporus var. microsporus]PHZ09603.1 hypothetical protein RHIMIDRAFT_240278 [Rhizopus microsporus ATCC 52813]CEG75993.1 Putative Structure-specific recognition protein 1 [Rhizopus microsporus]
MGKETTKVTRKAAAKDDDAKKPARRQKKTTTGPKRGLSAYMFFSQDNREVVKKENPSASFGEIGKLLGEKWKKMTEEQKKPYIEKAEADKKRYEEEKAAQS